MSAIDSAYLVWFKKLCIEPGRSRCNNTLAGKKELTILASEPVNLIDTGRRDHLRTQRVRYGFFDGVLDCHPRISWERGADLACGFSPKVEKPPQPGPVLASACDGEKSVENLLESLMTEIVAPLSEVRETLTPLPSQSLQNVGGHSVL